MAYGPNISFDFKPEDFQRLNGTAPSPVTGLRPDRVNRPTAPPAPSRFIAPPANGAATVGTPAPVGGVASQPPAAPTLNPITGLPAPATAPKVDNQGGGVGVAPPPAPVKTTVTTTPMPVEAPAPAPVQQVQPPATPPAPVKPPVEAPVQQPNVTTSTGQAPTTPPVNAALTDDPFKNAMTDFMNTAKNWMSGQSDPAVKTTLNHALDQMGLQNQASMDALKMQINQDPTLRGQGAGLALLSSMARDQNFKVDDLIANMSEKNLERIVNMQKYGFEAATNLEKTQYARREDQVQNLIAAGDYESAAKLLGMNADSVAPGLGINITPESLKNRDPYEIKRLTGILDMIKSLAKTDPKAATALLNSAISSNPTLKSWLPDGITADQMIAGLVSGESAANAQAASTVQSSIRADIASGGDFESVSKRLADMFAMKGRNAEKEGAALSLDRINEIRKEEGLPALLDKSELDEVDYTDLGYKNEFYKEKATANEAPWQSTYDSLMKSYGSSFLDPTMFKGGADALKDFLINQQYGTVEYEWDPATQTLVPSVSSDSLPWNDPDLFGMFYHMPMAQFDASGKVVGDYSNGGTMYSETSPKTQQDSELQPKYAAYVQSVRTSQGKPLSATQWYFATAGGTKPVNTANIPEGITKGTANDPNAVTNIGGAGNTSVFDPIKFKSDFALLTSTDAATKLKDPTFLRNAIDSGAVPVVNNAATLATTNWADMAKTGLGYAAINGKPVKIGATGTTKPPDAGGKGVQYVMVTKDGKTYWLVTKSDSPKYPAGMMAEGNPSSAPINISSQNIGNF